MFKQYLTKQEYLRDRVPMFFGSLLNLYSNSKNPPRPEELYEKAVEFAEKTWIMGTINDEFDELDQKLMEKALEEYKEREIGRYYASELFYYFKNIIPPEEFLKPKLPDLIDLKRMAWGTIIHEGIQKLFGFEEKKYEIPIDEEIKIIGKIDLELPNGEIVEIKTKEVPEMFESIPPSYLYQCTAYMKVKGLDKMRLYLIGWGLSRKRFDIKFDPMVWQDIVERLKLYHQKVVLKNATKKI